MDSGVTWPVAQSPERPSPEHPSLCAHTSRTVRVAAHLIDIVRMQQWEFLLENPKLITRRPAKFHDAEGLYPLHWAVAGRAPLAVVQALLNGYPKAIRRSTREGESVLHLATQYGSKETEGVVGYILQRYPQAAHQLDQYGRSPIFHAVLTQRLSVLKELVWAAPAMVATISLTSSNSPSVSEPTKVPIRRKRALQTPLYRLWAKAMTDPIQTQPPSGETWEKAMWLLLAAHQHAIHETIPNEPANVFHEEASFDSKQVVHAAIQMSAYLPDAVLNTLVTAYPEHLRVSNAMGQWPLSVALMIPPQNGSRSASSTMVPLLLSADPEAAKHSSTTPGRCALMEAIGSGHSWNGLESSLSAREASTERTSVLQALFQAAPDMILTRDAPTGLPPALLAAATQPQRPHEVVDPNPPADIDPCSGLSDKQREMLCTAATVKVPLDTVNPYSDEAEHLTTIFALLQANPSQLLYR
jgi:Ankyrin repeats (3 copies)